MPLTCGIKNFPELHNSLGNMVNFHLTRSEFDVKFVFSEFYAN